jgi:hypothetical protein
MRPSNQISLIFYIALNAANVYSFQYGCLCGSKRIATLQAYRDDAESLSPWSPGKWKITLQFSRDEDPYSPDASGENKALLNRLLGDDWGTNAAQLALPVEIMVTADVSTKLQAVNAKPSVQSVWLGGKPTGSIECIQLSASDEIEPYHATYINDNGQQRVQISPGQWRIEPPIPLISSATGKTLRGQASTLRFSLTIQTAIRRNSIYFPENQLLLLQSNAFREEQFDEGVQTMIPFQYEKDKAQKMLDQQLDHESGDRRLDGKDLLPLLEGFKDIAGLVWERDDKYRKWKEIEGVLPIIDDRLEDDCKWGIWPGDTDLLTIERGVILAVIEKKETRVGGFPWIENRDGAFPDTVVVGRWTAVPTFDEN